MCRASAHCRALGTDPDRWDRRCPLPPPNWFAASVAAFAQSFAEAAAGNRDAALAWLQATRGDELRDWFVEHAQNTFRYRVRAFPAGAGPIPEAERDPVKGYRHLEAHVMRRDSYHCRYCGVPVVHESAAKAYAAMVGPDVFRATGTNAERHGIRLALSACLDHVIPHSRGGATSPENLVTACWSCNYGKKDYSVEELGMDDPRLRSPTRSAWDGLTAAVSALR